MNTSETGQVTRNAAEVYEEFFVPALFQEWADRIADAGGIRQGQRVLDVACGTGVLARTIADRVGPSGSVVGLDLNDGMLAVARRLAPGIEWRQGRAEALPFEAEQFDAVVSQFGLMFFQDPKTALQEMLRVLRREGSLVIAVWDSIEKAPGYAALSDLIQRLFGGQAAAALQAPFALGKQDALASLFAGAGIANVRIRSQEGRARFPSLDAWLFTEIKGWVLADQIDDVQFHRLRLAAGAELKRFVAPDGSVVLRMPALVASAVKESPDLEQGIAQSVPQPSS